MLSDLVQFFTNKEQISVDKEMDLTRMLQFFYTHTNIEEIKKGIEANVIFNPEVFYELNEVWFDDMYMNDIHLGDCLELAYDNNLVQMVFSTFMQERDFDIEYDDIDVYQLFEGEIDEDKSIDQFMGFELQHKIDKFTNNWIEQELSHYIGPEDTIDDYFLEMSRVIFMHITFRNKSLARKLRKVYSQNVYMREMFENLNIFMMNGEFITLMMYNAETGLYGDYIDIEKVYTGVEEIRESLGISNENEIGHRLKSAFLTLNYELQHDEGYCGNHYVFFNRIMKEHHAPKGEVIL